MNAMTHPWPAHISTGRGLRPALFRGLSTSDMRRIRREFTEEDFDDGTAVPRDTAHAPWVGLILSGALREDLHNPDGRRHLFALTFAGEVLQPLGPRRINGALSAMGPTKILTCSREGFDTLAAAIPRLQFNLLGVVQDQLVEVQRWQVLLGRKTATERVASMLTWFHQRQSAPDQLDLALTRAEMGQLLGLTLETVSRQMRALQKSGIIGLPEPMVIRIQNAEALQSLCGDAQICKAEA